MNSALKIISSQGIVITQNYDPKTKNNSSPLSNRSHAYVKMNKLSQAVRDAKYTVAMRPDWGKGYFRLGRALSGQDNPGEALVAFFHCLVLEETCSKALRAEIVQVNHKTFVALRSFVSWQEFCKIMLKEERGSRMDLDGQSALDSCCASQVRSDEERQ